MKNILHKIPNNEWVGFWGYRRFWEEKNKIDNNFNNAILKNAPNEWNNYDVIILDKLDFK